MSSSDAYVQYEIKEQVDYLNQNVIHNPNKINIFPRHIYNGEVMRDGYFVCSRPRDTEVSYIIGVERDKHPDHFAHFGYARADYGYGSGHWPGRYNTSNWCATDPQPKGMAPERFYDPVHQGPFASLSQGQIDYNWEKNYGMNHF